MPDVKEPSNSQNLDQVVSEESAKLCDDRQFWESCISWLIGEDSVDVERAINRADRLTEARRQRFPVQIQWINNDN